MAIIKPEQLSSGSYNISGSFSGSFQGDGSGLNNLPIPSIETGSFVTTSSFNSFTGSYNTGSFTGSFTGSLLGTASYATQALSASFAPSTPAFPFTGSALITGSLGVTGSASILAFTSSAASIFAVRNSANTQNLFNVLGNGVVASTNSSTSAFEFGGTYKFHQSVQGFSSNGLSMFEVANVSGNYLGSLRMHDTIGNVLVKLGGDVESSVINGQLYLNRGANARVLISATNAGGYITGLNYLNVGYGTTLSTGAALDVKSQGALSTDIAFRVRNSSDTANLISIQGNGTTAITAPANGFTSGFSVTVGGQSRYRADEYRGYLDGIHYVDTLGRAGSDSIGFYTGLGLSNQLSIRPQYGSISLGSISTLGDGGNTLYIKNPSFASNPSSIVDGISLYSADITAGNAAPHFRTENGSIIKLYQQSSVTSSQGLADALTNLGLLTGSSAIVSSATFPYTGSAQITGSLGVTGSASILAFTSSNASIFTIRNSADTFNVFETRGDVSTIFRRSNNTENTLLVDGTNNYIDLFRPDGAAHRGIRLFKSSSNLNSLEYYTQNSSTNGHFLFKSQPANVSGYGTSAPAFVFDVGTTGVTFTAGSGRIHLGNDTPTTLQTAGLGGYTFLIKNGTSPTTSSADNFIIYSADRGGTAGKASAHFRAEDGTINVLGDLSGIGTATPGARLDVLAQGALSTDVAFRVRNSGNTANILTARGDKSISFFNETEGINFTQPTAGTAKIAHYAVATLPSYLTIESIGAGGSIGQIRFDAFDGSTPAFTVQRLISGLSDLTGSSLYSGFGTNAATFIMKNALNYGGYGITPTGTAADHFAMYSADITAGNAAPHFRTENGSIIKLYKEIQPALSGSANTGDAATDALIEAMKTIILNLGFGSSS